MALHCSGKFAEMADVAGAAPELAGKALMRFDNALGYLQDPVPFDETEAIALVSEAAATRVADIGADPTVQA